MSGGHFNYSQSRIADIYEEIERLLEDRQDDEDFILDYEDMENPEEVKQIFKDAILVLKKAHIYAQRIDWYLSGDDGEETLKQRLEEDLRELNIKA